MALYKHFNHNKGSKQALATGTLQVLLEGTLQYMYACKLMFKTIQTGVKSPETEFNKMFLRNVASNTFPTVVMPQAFSRFRNIPFFWRKHFTSTVIYAGRNVRGREPKTLAIKELALCAFLTTTTVFLYQHLG